MARKTQITKHLFFLLFLLSGYTFGQNSRIFESYHQIMGVDFVVAVVVEDSVEANEHIAFAVQETKRIEGIISSWDKHSQTSEINRNAGVKPVRADRELFDLIQRSIRISKLTDGAFDITVGPLIDLWKIDGGTIVLPDSQSIHETRFLVDYNAVVLNADHQTVYLEKKGMKLGFGAIGKGYVAELLKEKLIERDVFAGMISAGGDIVVWGKHPKNEYWSIGIADPNEDDGLIGYLKLGDNAVVTSGNYEKFIEIDGKKYTHIIDPNSGVPVEGVKSVSIICPNAELADALATSCFVLGIEKSLKLLNQLSGIEGLLIDSQNNIHTTNSFAYEDKL